MPIDVSKTKYILYNACLYFLLGTLILARILNCVWWINSFANPLIYAWRQREFRRAFNKMLGLETGSTDTESRFTASTNVLPP